MASKFADAVVVRFGKGKGKAPAPEPDADDAVPPAPNYSAKDNDEDDKPGARGKLLAAAIRKGDGEAIEECIRAICG